MVINSNWEIDMKIVYTAKALNDVDGSIKAAVSGYDDAKKKIQVACVSILAHAEKCGDYTKANTLIDSLKGLNQRALVEFFVRFGGFIVDEEAGKFSGWNGKEFIRKGFQDAKATMWWDLKPQNPFEGYSLDADVARVIDKAEKNLKKLAKHPEYGAIININTAKLEALKALAA